MRRRGTGGGCPDLYQTKISARNTGMAFERDGGSLSPAELAVNPRVLSRLLRALGERHLPAAGITGLVRCDPALTLQVLLAGASNEEEEEAFSLQSCVDRVGPEVLEALLVQQAVRGLGERPDVGPHGALHEVWRRSLLCACTAEALAERAGQSGEPAYVAGLLHAVGKLALLGQRSDYAATLAAARSDLELLRVERSTTLRPHDAVGAALVTRLRTAGVSRRCDRPAARARGAA